MRITDAVRAAAAALVLCFYPPLAAAVQLVPVVTNLSSPVFVGNAGDGTNRLFIVEQSGVIRVLQPGASTATIFLDIRSKVIAGGERASSASRSTRNTRPTADFFVYYTRVGDGALVIAEYHVSRRIPTSPTPAENDAADDPASDQFEPQRRHARVRARRLPLHRRRRRRRRGNDPPNNAQNLDALLGKILRIDVDHADAAPARVLVAADNPFVGTAPGATRSSRYGLRNPWRFSFDRATGQQWVADVGQGAREEVDTPIVKRRQLRLAGLRGHRAARATIRRCATRRTTRSRSSTTRTRTAAARSPAAMSIAERRARCRRERTSTATTASGEIFALGRRDADAAARHAR